VRGFSLITGIYNIIFHLISERHAAKWGRAAGIGNRELLLRRNLSAVEQAS